MGTQRQENMGMWVEDVGRVTARGLKAHGDHQGILGWFGDTGTTKGCGDHGWMLGQFGI